MKNKLYILIFLLITDVIIADELQKNDSINVRRLILAIKSHDKSRIANHVRYPLKRPQPLLNIKTAKEFISRYDEIMSDSIENLILVSNVAQHWSRVGYNGVMLNDGDIWIDDDGKIIAINIETKLGSRIRDSLNRNDKRLICSRLKDFEENMCVFNTKSFIIRIDKTKNGYRYASWKIGSNTSDDPEIILSGGLLNLGGSSGNLNFEFKNGNYRYFVFKNEVSERNTVFELRVTKGGKEILKQYETK